MSEILEALFISTFDNNHASCAVTDLRTGTDLMRYKGGGSLQPHSLEFIDGNYLLAANSMKPLLHVWPINGQEQMHTIRFVVPGKVNALALSPDSAFLLAAIQESIYIWHLNTGRMLNTLSKHYQPITCLRFTESGNHFASGGKDGTVLFWNLTSTVAPQGPNDEEANTPIYSFNDHGLCVTDVHIGIGGMRSYMYTVSLDRCCKIYNLQSGDMLLSVVFPIALHSVVANTLETNVYVGTAEGTVLVFSMRNVPRMKEYHLEENESQAFVGHTVGLPVTCLALSVTGQQLISGGEDKKVCIWDVTSKQLIRSLSQSGAITNLHVRLSNPGIFQPQHKFKKVFAESLARMISPPDEDEFITLQSTVESDEEDDCFERRLGNLSDLYDKNIEIPIINLNETGELKQTQPDAVTESDTVVVDDNEDDNQKVEASSSSKAKSKKGKVGGTSSDSVDIEKLLAENARLKQLTKSMFEMAFEKIADTDEEEKQPKLRKKARKS